MVGSFILIITIALSRVDGREAVTVVVPCMVACSPVPCTGEGAAVLPAAADGVAAL